MIEKKCGGFKMKRIFSIILILLFASSLVFIADKHAQAIQKGTATKVMSPINALLKATIDILGNSRSSVASKIGKPSSISLEFIPNTNKPLQDDKIYTMTYNWIIIWIYQDATNNKEELLSVRMTKNRKELLPELIGKSEENIISKYGQPANFSEGKIEYEPPDDESGLGTIEFDFKNSSVDAVELTYNIE
jgi:hypothetical protein